MREHRGTPHHISQSSDHRHIGTPSNGTPSAAGLSGHQPTDQPSTSQPSVSQPSAGQTIEPQFANQPSGQQVAAQTTSQTITQPSTSQTSANQTSTSQPSTTQPSAGQPSAGQPSTGQTIEPQFVSQPSTGQTADAPAAERPLTIALVMDTIGNQGNGTSNSALQYAHELERQGHHVRLVGIGAPEYPARINRVPLVSWVAAKQQMQFAEPSETLFRTAFAGADVVHLYLPFKFGRAAYKTARRMGIPVTAGFHLQPENVTYSAGPLKHIPGMSSFLYALFRHWLYRRIGHIHVPTEMIAGQLRAHGYQANLHVISNGYVPRFTPKTQPAPDAPSPVPFRIVVSGRLSHEKDQITLIKAIARCRHAKDIELTICGTGPLRRYLQFRAGRLLARPASIGFHRNADMPALLRSCDLFVHPSIVDIESLSVIEGMASGLVPVIASAELSAASQFALLDESLFPAHDAVTLARRIDWWIDHPSERAAWGARYAEYAKQHYSVESAVTQFVAMEREAIADNR